MRRGSSFRTLSPAARRRIAGSRSDRGWRAIVRAPGARGSGPRARTGKYVRPTTIRTMPTRRPAKSGVPVGNVPAVTGTGCLRASEPAIASTTHDRQEAAGEHRQAERRVVPVGVPGEAAERRAVVVRRRGERVDDLGEAVRPGVQDRRLGVVEENRDRGEGEDRASERSGCRGRRASSPSPGSSCRGTRASVRP